MAGPSDIAAADRADGRIQRSERSREAIVNAILELVEEGDQRPTAERVAERAGVGIRTVFRHFSDMEGLYAAMNERLRSQILPLLRMGPGEEGSLEERVADFIEARCTFFERLLPFWRSSNLFRWRSAFLQADHVATSRDLRNHLLLFFPELRDVSTDLLEAVDWVSSLEGWDRLRTEQRLGRARAAVVQRVALEALLRDELG
jgi:AcrR family transcriptional regulator